jgi:hypothetical protein
MPLHGQGCMPVGQTGIIRGRGVLCSWGQRSPLSWESFSGFARALGMGRDENWSAYVSRSCSRLPNTVNVTGQVYQTYVHFWLSQSDTSSDKCGKGDIQFVSNVMWLDYRGFWLQLVLIQQKECLCRLCDWGVTPIENFWWYSIFIV